MNTIRLHDKEFELYIPSYTIQSRVKNLAEKISEDMTHHTPLFIGVLNGAFLFCADLFKHITIECEISFIKVSSYKGTDSKGKIKNLIGLNEDVNGRDVIFVEDIIDTGMTARFLNDEINKFNPKSITWASLLLKPDKLIQPINIKYLGFEIPNDFIVGYGMDYDGLGRNLQDLYVLKNKL
jgi:hypoxanthine phosphoribosyltransferase